MKKGTSPKRREFLKISAAGAAGIALTSGGMNRILAKPAARTANGTAPLNSMPGRVVVNFNKNAPAALSTDATAAQVTTIKTMVDDAIKLLTGITDIGTAWKSLFPSTLSMTSKILIKIPQGFNNSLSVAHWSSVQAITDGLQKMTFGASPNTTTFPAANITIFDGTGTNNLTSRGFTAANFPNINIVFYPASSASFAAFADSPKNYSGSASLPYATVLNAAAFLINVFSPRGHGTQYGDFTLGFKNHYGTFDAPTLPHDNSPSPNAGQTIRNLNSTGVVYTKNMLSMCSGIWGQYEGSGPGGSPQNYSTYSKHMDPTSTNTTPTTIIMSTDPVSAEMQAIKMMRIQGAKTYAVADMPDYLKASGGVAVTGTNWPPDPAAASVMDNIGVIDESKMKVLNILNGVITTGIEDRESLSRESGSPAFVTAKQINGHNCTFIEFKLPADRIGGEAVLSIFTVSGSLVCRMPRKILGVLNSYSWDEKDGQGRLVSKGTYVVRLESGMISQSSRFRIVR
jgi:hypothetical protein